MKKTLVLFFLLLSASVTLFSQDMREAFFRVPWDSDLATTKDILIGMGAKSFYEDAESISSIANYPDHKRMISFLFYKEKLAVGSMLYSELKIDVISMYNKIFEEIVSYYGNPVKIVEDYSFPFEKGKEFTGSAIETGKVNIQSVWLVNNDLMVVLHITKKLEVNIIYYKIYYLQETM